MSTSIDFSDRFKHRRFLTSEAMIMFIEGRLADITQITITDIKKAITGVIIDQAKQAFVTSGIREALEGTAQTIVALNQGLSDLGSNIATLSSSVSSGFSSVSTSISTLESFSSGASADLVSLKTSIQFNDGLITEPPIGIVNPPRLRLVPGPTATISTPYYMTIIPRFHKSPDNAKGYIYLANSDALDASGPPITLGGRGTHIRPDHDLRRVIVRVGTSFSASNEAFFARENIGGNKAVLDIGAVRTSVLILNGQQVTVDPETGNLKVAV